MTTLSPAPAHSNNETYETESTVRAPARNNFYIDATVIRVLFVVLAILGGSGLVLYLALWIIVPKEP